MHARLSHEIDPELVTSNSGTVSAGIYMEFSYGQKLVASSDRLQSLRSRALLLDSVYLRALAKETPRQIRIRNKQILLVNISLFHIAAAFD